MKRLGLAGSVVLLALLGAASPTLAQAPSASPSAGPDRAKLEQQRDRVLQQLRERGLALGSASSWPSPPAASGSAPPAAALPSGLPVSEVAAELKRRWRAHGESRLERRERHRATLVRELGQRLSDPLVKAELKLHATRMAELARIQFLAENARKGAEREKLLARVAKLSARETTRHRQQLARLAAAAPSARPAPSSSGAPR